MNTNKVLATGFVVTLGWLIICGIVFAWITGSILTVGAGLLIGGAGMFIFFKLILPNTKVASEKVNSMLANVYLRFIYVLAIFGNISIVITLFDNFKARHITPDMLILNWEFIGSLIILILFFLIAWWNPRKI